MTQKITIILKKNQTNLGKKGTVAKVAPGYAFNYLIPNNIAEIASNNTIKHFEMFKELASKQNEKNILNAQTLNSLLQDIKKITVLKKVGENKQFFGSINDKEISKILFKYTGKLFDKKQINMEHLKYAGIARLKILISENIESTIILQIVPANI